MAGFRLPTRFRAWSTTVSALHGRVAGHYQGPRNEGALLVSYADDTQVHVSIGAADVETAVQKFVSCMERIESWMSSNRLNMNADKTQVLWIGSIQTTACQSRHQGVPAVVCQHFIFHHSVQSRRSSVDPLKMIYQGELMMTYHKPP